MIVSAAGAHEPITTKLTWTKEVSRIVYKRCVGCHREGGRAPMSMLTYEEARPWAKAIRDEVLERRMPPWGAVKGFGEFRNDVSLSEREIEMLAGWVEGGAPEGEAIYLPPLPAVEASGPAVAAATEAIALEKRQPLERMAVALGIRVPDTEGWKWAQVWARRPGGAILPLAWIQHRSRHQPQDYYFVEPIRLGKGTEVQVLSEGGAQVSLLIEGRSPSPQIPRR